MLLPTHRLKRWVAITATTVALVSCSGGSADDFDETQVRQQAARAAVIIANSHGSDTLEMQRAIVAADAMRSDYIVKGQQRAAEFFDQVLADSLKARDPEMAAEIFPSTK